MLEFTIHEMMKFEFELTRSLKLLLELIIHEMVKFELELSRTLIYHVRNKTTRPVLHCTKMRFLTYFVVAAFSIAIGT